MKVSLTTSSTAAAHLPKAESHDPSVSLSINDPQQSVRSRGPNTFVISGNVRNNGIIQSSVRLQLDGKTVNVPLNSRMTPKQTAEAIEAALPAGYFAIIAGFRTGTDVGITIVRTPLNDTERIVDGFEAAAAKNTPGGINVTKGELQKIVKGAKAGGLTNDEKWALSERWAFLFTGAGYLATDAAIREYARIAQKLNLPPQLLM
jgi:hypothetical protein